MGASSQWPVPHAGTPFPSIQRIGDVAGVERLAPEWDAIDALCSPRTPFTSPGWNLAWWRHFGEDNLWIRDELFVLAMRDERACLVAVVPLMRTFRPSFGPLRVREIQFMGADTSIMELRGVICRPEHRMRALRSMHLHLMQHKQEWDSLMLCGIPPGESAETSGAAPPYRTVRDYYLRLPDTWQTLVAGLSRNMKEALRKSCNSLRREGHFFKFQVVARPVEIEAALEHFFRLHRARAQREDTVPHPDRFSSARARGFLRDHAQWLAQRDQLRIFQLEIGGRVVASRIGFLLGDELYLYYSGYLTAWARFSVMTTLTAECIKWAIAQRLRIVNLSTGDDRSKARWRPTESAASDYLLWSPLVGRQTIRGRLLGALRNASRHSMLGRAVAVVRRPQ